MEPALRTAQRARTLSEHRAVGAETEVAELGTKNVLGNC